MVIKLATQQLIIFGSDLHLNQTAGLRGCDENLKPSP